MDQQRLLLNTERKGQKSCLVFLRPGGNSSQQIVFRRASRQGLASGGDAHAEGSEAGMGTRLSSQPLPLSPFAVTLNNTLSLITATITLRNKLVFFERGTEMGKRRPSYACGMPSSLQRLHLFGDRQTADQFSAWFFTLYNSFSLFVPFFLPCFSIGTLWSMRTMYRGLVSTYTWAAHSVTLSCDRSMSFVHWYKLQHTHCLSLDDISQ